MQALDTGGFLVCMRSAIAHPAQFLYLIAPMISVSDTQGKENGRVPALTLLHHSLTLLQVAVTVGLLWWLFHDPARRAVMGAALKMADWSWIVPPVSGSLTPVFHRYYDEPDPTIRPAYLPPPDTLRGHPRR